MVLEVLKNCTVEGNVIKLPTGQLDRKVYTEVKNKLELIGGKWKGGKVQGFVFEEDPTELLTDLQNGDERNLKKEYQFFPTPPDIAQQMVSNLPTLTDELKILEPSAGDGALIKALRLHRNWDKNVDCFELMDINRKKLAKIDGSLLFAEPDFLKSVELASYPHLIEQYDIIIANPPFTKNQDIDHILAMYKCLKPGGTIITLASPSWTTGTQKKQVEFKEWLESMDVFPLTLPEKSFAASGTMITPLLLQIKKPKVVANYIPPESKFANKPFGQEFDSEIIEAFKKGDELKNPTNMNFFQTLYEMLDGIDLNIQFKRVNGNLELNVIPEMAAGVKPVKIIGTAEELDAEFFTVIYKPIDKFKGVKVDMEAFEKSADKAKEEKEEEDDDTEKTTTNKKAPISSKKALPKKQLAEKKAVTQSEPSLFD